MSKQRRFAKAFKLETIRQMESGEKTVADLSRDLGIGRNTLYQWREQYQELGSSAFSRSGDGNVDAHPEKDDPEMLRKEVTRLKRELESTRQDVEILKKATAYFAKQSK